MGNFKIFSRFEINMYYENIHFCLTSHIVAAS